MPKFYCGATSAVLLLHCLLYIGFLCNIVIEGCSAVLCDAVRFGKREARFCIYNVRFGKRGALWHCAVWEARCCVTLCGLASEREGGGVRFCAVGLKFVCSWGFY
jgi:hypothetical protein